MHFAGSPACDREILAGEMDESAIDRGAAGNHPIGRHRLVGHTEVASPVIRKQANLLKAVAIHQLLHSFTRCELAGRMLLRDAFLAAAEFDGGSPRTQVGNLFVHRLLTGMAGLCGHREFALPFTWFFIPRVLP